MSTTQELSIVERKNEINKQLGDKETFTALMTTTFKGLEPQIAKRAVLEGVLRGFDLEDFLKKNVYAIPFKQGYTLVTSIDYARKIGMRSGVVGKSAPTFEMDDKKVISCTVTVKRMVKGHVGEWTATVFFSEYYKSGGLWDTKPRTMIGKVAEMHALRAACPEELSQSYTEEEYDAEIVPVSATRKVIRKQYDENGYEIPRNPVVTSTGDDTQGLDVPADIQDDLEKETNK